MRPANVSIITGFALKVLMLLGVLALCGHVAFGGDLIVYVNDPVIADPWSDLAREALIDPIEQLEAKVPHAEDYIAEVRECREMLDVRVLSLVEAGLPSDTVVPAFSFGRLRAPTPIRRDMLHLHTSLLRYLDYLCRLNTHLLNSIISPKSLSVWYTADTEMSRFSDGDIVTQVRYTRWRMTVEPYPPADVHCRWSREITYLQDGVKVGQYTIEFDGTPETEIIEAMDAGTGWAAEGLQTARENAMSKWNRSLKQTFMIEEHDPCMCP